MSSGIVEPKPGLNVGRILVSIAVHNVDDLERADRGEMRPDEVRRLQLDALVDSGATFFCLPEPRIEALGLTFDRKRDTRSVTGAMQLAIYRGARIDVQGRSCNVEVMALPEGRQALLGQIPLETLDWWIDTTNRRLVGNPEHGGQWMADVF